MKKNKTINRTNSKTIQKKNNLKFITLAAFAVIGLIIFFVFFQSNEQISPTINPKEKLEDNINVKSIPESLEAKTITAGYEFGFLPDNGLENSLNLISLVDDQEKSSIRFTAKYSGEVSEIILHLRSNTENEIIVGIQDDKQGVPSGKWLGDNSGFYVVSTINNSTKNLNINLKQKLTLDQGKIYHIVIEPKSDFTKNYFWVATYHTNWPFEPLNQENPDETWSDPAINTLYFDGNSWIQQDKWPIFSIEYADGFAQGQPYSLMAQWVIYGDRFAGQLVTPYYDYKIGEISFVINKRGNPQDSFYYAIYDQQNNILINGTFAKNNELSDKKQWQTTVLEKPVLFEKNKSYNVVLSSPGSDDTNYYQLFGHEFMLDGSIGYGSIRHYLTASHNAGQSFAKWYDADAAFKFTTVE